VRNRITLFIALLFTAQLLLHPVWALADGGTLRISERYKDFQVSVFTSPAVLRCGPIDISVLVQEPTTGKVRTDIPVTIQLQQADSADHNRTPIVLEQAATTTIATNKLFRAAIFDVMEPGNWQVTILLNENSSGQPLTDSHLSPTFTLAISPPPPAWLALAPWIAWPFAAIALFFVHQRLASRPVR
jgi:hypothetical protein